MRLPKGLLEEFPVAQRVVYLNTAGVGLIPKSVIDALDQFNRRILTTPPYEDLFDDFDEMVEETRNRFGDLIGASREEISFLGNTSTAINLAVQMLNPKSGENVVVDDLGFPSDVYPLLARRRKGVEVRMLRNKRGAITSSDYAQRIDSKTRLVMVSYVSWINGLRSDVEEIGKIARERGAYYIIDSTHGTGYLEIDVKKWKVDFLATSNYKWLLSPFGSAELYCSRELLEKVRPPHLGWHSVNETRRGFLVDRYRLRKSARRLEAGNPDYSSIYGLGESLGLLRRAGLGEIRRKTLGMSGTLIDGLRKLGLQVPIPPEEERRSGIVFAYARKLSGVEIAKRLRKVGIWVTARYYGVHSGIRVSPYFYTRDEDIANFLGAMKRVLRG